jgi:hypothetical protein
MKPVLLDGNGFGVQVGQDEMKKEANPASNTTALKPDDRSVALPAFTQEDYNRVYKNLCHLLELIFGIWVFLCVQNLLKSIVVVALAKMVISVVDVLELNLCKRVSIIFEAFHAPKRLELLVRVVCEVGQEH